MALFPAVLSRSIARHHCAAEARIVGRLLASQRHNSSSSSSSSCLVARSLASHGALRISSPRLARKAPSAKAPPAGTPPPAAAAAKDEWTEVKDASGQVYWWNERTNETTPIGAPKPGPDPWQEVNNNGQVYWWNKETNATTAAGAPKPPYDAASAVAGHPQEQAVGQAQPSRLGGLGGAMAEGMAWGVGTSVASRMVDGVMGPRQMEVVHRDDGGAAAAGGAGDMGPPPPGMDAGGMPGGGDMGGGDLNSQGWSWGEGDQNASSGGDDGGDEGGGMLGGLGDWFGGGDGW